MTDLPLNPRHGTHAPISGTTPRRSGSIRRTSTIDTNRSAQAPDRLVVTGRARDLLTRFDGTSENLGEVRLDAVVDYSNECELVSISATPAFPALEALLGAAVGSGFRGKAIDAMPIEAANGTLLNLLVDDLPGAILVSGYAASRIGHFISRPNQQAQGDLCSGWRHGGTIMIEISAGRIPPIVTGPQATRLDRDDDTAAWHQLDPLGPNGMRRARRLDVYPGDEVRIDAYFRDSHRSLTGEHTSIHEYSLDGKARDGVIESLQARAHALPWLECPHAVESAAWLVGTPLHDLRRRVRRDFVGIDTCTHLNDMLRSLADVEQLATQAVDGAAVNAKGK
jgi:hypothetical protein